jgi:hypothetical protein
MPLKPLRKRLTRRQAERRLSRQVRRKLSAPMRERQRRWEVAYARQFWAGFLKGWLGPEQT